MKSRIWGLLAVTAMILTAGVHSASAETVSLRVSSGAFSCTLADNGLAASGGCTGSDSVNTLGAISWSTSIGDWGLTANTGVGSALLGAGSLDLAFVGLHSSPAPSTLTIEFTQVSTSPSFSSFILGIGGTLGSGATASYAAFVDNSNTAFGKPGGGQIGSTLVFVTPGPFSGSTSGTGGGSGALYSLTQVVTLTSNGLGIQISSGDATVSAPEPTSLVLLGAGLTGIAAAFRRKSRSK